MDKDAGLGAAFRAAVGRPLARNVSLKDLSSFRIGGPADLFFDPESPAELAAAVQFARRAGLPHRVIGGGYNMLFDDDGYRGLIIRNRAQGLAAGPDGIDLLSGTPLSRLHQHVLEAGLEGLEFLAGIPGTVGGAIYGNAGAFGQAICDVLVRAVLLEESGEERAIGAADLGFAYRHSALKARPAVVLSATLRAAPGDPESVRRTVREFLECRRTKQPPWGTFCAGSYFKNPVRPDGTKAPAGRLLEEAGAKALRVGDAAVFSGHANFLVNLGAARAADVLALAAELKRRVRERSGVELEEEVIFLPAVAAGS